MPMATLVEQLMTELNSFIAQDGIDDQEKRWAARQTSNPALKAQLERLSTTDIKIITALGATNVPHAKMLPAITGLSQATISRGITKLEQLKLATKYRDDHNHKEILVRLTTAGQQVVTLHHQLDAAIAIQAQQIAADYSPAELTRFVELMHRIREIKI